MGTKILKRAMTPQEVSEAYGISVGTLGNWRSMRVGPRFYRINAKGSNRCKVLYMVEDIESWVMQSPVLTMDK